jgi:hypothetical protein
MTDHVLSCHEVVEFFAAETGRAGFEQQLSEGAQNAFVNLYHRLAEHCPGTACEQLRDCVLRSGGEPKRFDSAEGKQRFLRMKVRTEGRRVHRRGGADVLRSDQVRLVGDVDSEVPSAAATDWVAELTAAAAHDGAIADALAAVRSRLSQVDLSTVRGAAENVAIAAEVVDRLVDRTGAAPLPETDEERREVVRRLFAEVGPHLMDGAPAAVRQRQKRLRDIVRVLLSAAGAEGLGELWVPMEVSKRRG